MRRRTKRAALFLSLALLAGAWLVTGYMLELGRKAEAEPALAESAGFDLSIGTQKDMTALSWAWNGQTVNLVRDERGAWVNADDAACPVDSEAAGMLARAAAAVTASMAIEGGSELAQYGLDEPALVVMAAAGDRIVSYEIGNPTILGEYYMRVDRGDTVYLENGGLAAAFRTDLASLLETETMPRDVTATALSVTTDAQSYELRVGSDGVWRRTDGEEAVELEDGPVRSLCELLLATDLTDCVGWDASGYGFSDPQGVVTLDYTDADGYDGALTLEYGDYDGRDVFVRFAGSGLVYRTSAAVLDALMYPDWDAMTPLTVLSVDPHSAAKLVFGLDGAQYEVLRLQEEEDEAVYSLDGWVLDTKRMDAWLAALAGLTAEGAAAADEGRAELFSLTIYPQTKDDEEPKPLTIALWQYDSARALCATEGRSLLVPKEDVLSLTEELRELITE